MWLSFLSNVLIFVVSLFLFYRMMGNITTKAFAGFVLLTGVSSFIAAFGHLPIIERELSNVLLFGSRVFSIVAIFLFITGTLQYFGYNQIAVVKWSNWATFLIAILWLVLKNTFTPVMIYGIAGMVGVGASIFLLNYKQNVKACSQVLVGISILACSAVIFAVYKTSGNSYITDFSHVLVALALIYFSRGFLRLKK